MIFKVIKPLDIDGETKEGKKAKSYTETSQNRGPSPPAPKKGKYRGGGKRSSNKARNIESQRAKENTEIPLVYR